MVHFNRALCVGCSACVDDCLCGCIALDGEGKAYLRQPQLCFACAHCIAVCPKAAVQMDEYDMEQVQPYDAQSFCLAPEVFLNAVKFRRSVRNYKARAVPRNIIESVLQAGRYTETAKNAQELQFVVVQETLDALKPLVWQGWNSMLEQMRERGEAVPARWQHFDEWRQETPPRDYLFFNAPALLVIGAKNPIDAGMALANIEHMLVAQGLGMVVMGFVQRAVQKNARAVEFLGLTQVPVAACALFGYPAVRYRRTAPRHSANIRWL